MGGLRTNAWDLPGIVPNDQGWMTDVEVATLVGFAAMLTEDIDAEPPRVLEIGCYRGRTTFALGRVAQVTCIDTFRGPTDRPEESGLREAFDANDDAQNAKAVLWSAEVLTGRSRDVLALLAHAVPETVPYDMAIIDGGHETETVLGDLCGVWPLVREGGFVFLDDVNAASVMAGFAMWRSQRSEVGSLVHVTPKLGYVRKVGGRCLP